MTRKDSGKSKSKTKVKATQRKAFFASSSSVVQSKAQRKINGEKTHF
jgi:hypothetical protein